MLFHVTVFLFVCIAASQAADGPCRCLPDQSSGVANDGPFAMPYAYDFIKKLILQEIGGTTFVKDLEKRKRYIFRGGNCKVYPMILENKDRCVPDHAELISETEDTVSYQWSPKESTTVSRTVDKNSCLLLQTVYQSSTFTQTLDYESVASIDDSTLDLDFSKCQ